MHDKDLIQGIRLRPALFGLDGSFTQSVTFLLGLDLGCAGGLLRGFTEWLVVRRGHDTSLRWNALILEAAFPDAGIRRPDSLGQDEDKRATECLFSLLVEFLEVRESPVDLARMYSAYFALCKPEGV